MARFVGETVYVSDLEIARARLLIELCDDDGIEPPANAVEVAAAGDRYDRERAERAAPAER